MISEAANLQEDRRGKIELGRGLRRLWVTGTILWIIYWVWAYGVYCRPPNPINIVCDWRPSDPSSSYFYYSISDVLRWIFGVPVLAFALGLVALWAAFWIVRGFRPPRPN